MSPTSVMVVALIIGVTGVVGLIADGNGRKWGYKLFVVATVAASALLGFLVSLAEVDPTAGSRWGQSDLPQIVRETAANVETTLATDELAEIVRVTSGVRAYPETSAEVAKRLQEVYAETGDLEVFGALSDLPPLPPPDDRPLARQLPEDREFLQEMEERDYRERAAVLPPGTAMTPLPPEGVVRMLRAIRDSWEDNPVPPANPPAPPQSEATIHPAAMDPP